MALDNPRRLRVLFLCTGNSCRSQMAEGWAKALKANVIDAYSAGTNPHGLNPLAVRVMDEAGVDISMHTSKRPDEIGSAFDVVVTVCDAAHESCPVLPGARVLHVGFDDPPRLASHARSDDEALPHYRRVRDEIRAFIETLPESLAPDNQKRKNTMTSQNDSACCAADCCETATPSASDMLQADAVREQVRAGYSKIAQAGSWSAASVESASSCCAPEASGGGGCCGATAFEPAQLAAAIGYSSDELAETPEAANMGLSCGNPTAIASLRAGEVVLDLGAGGGFDCFVAGKKVGPGGRVIGVDMTAEMVSKARRNSGVYLQQTGLANVEFRLGEIENLPLADTSVDVVISNCVLNLSPDKPRVWREIARVLKPGGRVAVSDLALLRPLPGSVRADVEALVGCVAGAVLIDDTRKFALAAGLTEVVLTPKPQYIDAMLNWKDPLYRKILDSLPAGSKPSDFITSLDVSARKAS